MVAVRPFLLVVAAALVVGFVVYVWNLDPDPAPYTYHYPTSTAAGSR